MNFISWNSTNYGGKMIITFIGHREVLQTDAVQLWVRQCILELGDPTPVFYSLL